MRTIHKIMIGGIFAIIVISIFDNNDANKENNNIQNITSKVKDETKQDLLKKIKVAYKLFETSKKENYKDMDLMSANIIVGSISSYADDIKKLQKKQLTQEEKKELNIFKKELSLFQKHFFPKIRDALGYILRREFFDKEIDVKTTGKDFKTIKFTSIWFASKKNISDFINIYYKTLFVNFRFKKAFFSWSKSSDYYTIDIKSPDDTDIINTYKKVENE